MARCRSSLPSVLVRLASLAAAAAVAPATLAAAVATVTPATLAVPAPPPAAPAAPARGIVRPGKWNPKDPPPGWVVIETRNYQVQSEVGEEVGRALAEHLEAMLDLYREMLPFRKRMPTFVLKVFESEEHFDAYSPVNATAYYSPSNRELVCYDTGVILGQRRDPETLALRDDWDVELGEAARARLDALLEATAEAYTWDLADVLSHEGWHQYFHYYTVSWVEMPAWLNEGLGDYFFMARPDGDGGMRLGDVNHSRLRRIRQAFETGKAVSFGDMLGFTQRDYYSDPRTFYAQGWSMVHFLMEHEDETYRELIPELIEDFKDTKNFEQSTETVLDKADLDVEDLDEEWIVWVVMQEVHDPLATLAEEFGEQVLPTDLEGPAGWIASYRWHWERRDAEDGRDG